MTTPPLDLTALRKTAVAATEGEWTVGLNGLGEAVYANWENEHGEYAKQVADVGGDLADAAHIAAFDPPTALALLDRVEAAGASMDRARVEVMAGEHAESCARRYAWAPDNCTCWKNAMLTALGWSNQ